MPAPACWRLLTTQYVDDLPLYRFEKVLGRHGVDIPRQTLARWVIQCGEHLQLLLNLMRDRLLESPVIHCDETLVQILKEPDRDLTSQSRMWVQASGPPESPVVLFDYATSRAQEVPLRLLADYRGYTPVITLRARSRMSSVWAAGPMHDAR